MVIFKIAALLVTIPEFLNVPHGVLNLIIYSSHDKNDGEAGKLLLMEILKDPRTDPKPRFITDVKSSVDVITGSVIRIVVVAWCGNRYRKSRRLEIK